MFLQEQIKDIIISPRRESCPSSKHFSSLVDAPGAPSQDYELRPFLCRNGTRIISSRAGAMCGTLGDMGEQRQTGLYSVAKRFVPNLFYRAGAYRDPTVPTTQYDGLCHVTLYHTDPLGVNHQASRTIVGDQKLGTPRAPTHHWHATPKQQAPQITTTTEHKQSHLFAPSWVTEARTIGVAPDGQAFRSAAMFGRSTCDRRTIATPHCCVSGKPATQCVQSHC